MHVAVEQHMKFEEAMIRCGTCKTIRFKFKHGISRYEMGRHIDYGNYADPRRAEMLQDAARTFKELGAMHYVSRVEQEQRLQ